MIRTYYFKLITIVALIISTNLNACADKHVLNLCEVPLTTKKIEWKHTHYSVPYVHNAVINDNCYSIKIEDNLFSGKKNGTIKIYAGDHPPAEIKAPGVLVQIATLTINDDNLEFQVVEDEECLYNFDISITSNSKIATRSFIYTGPESSLLFKCQNKKIPALNITASSIYLPQQLSFLKLIMHYKNLDAGTMPFPCTQSLENGSIKYVSPPESQNNQNNSTPSKSIKWPEPTSTNILFNDSFAFTINDLIEIVKKALKNEKRNQDVNWKDWDKNHKAELAKATNDSDKTKYLQKHILSTMDNDSKGNVGEEVVTLYMKNAGWKIHDSKAGDTNQGIDLVCSKDGIVEIIEVKYSMKNKKPRYVRENIDGQEWRQLSIPYINTKLATLNKLATENNDKEKIATLKLIKDTSDTHIKLRFAMFNAEKLTIDFYDIGDMTRSLMD